MTRARFRHVDIPKDATFVRILRPPAWARALEPHEEPVAFQQARAIDALRLELKRTIRELRGDMTQERLAELTGIPQPALSRLESPSSARMPTLETLMRIAWATGRTLQVKFFDRDALDQRFHQGKARIIATQPLGREEGA